MDQGKSVLKFKAHENRLRGLFSTYGQMREESTYLFSTSSDGYVKLWLFADVSINLRDSYRLFNDRIMTGGKGASDDGQHRYHM